MKYEVKYEFRTTTGKWRQDSFNNSGIGWTEKEAREIADQLNDEWDVRNVTIEEFDNKPKTFKQLVKLIHWMNPDDEDQKDRIQAEISWAFDQGSISYQDFNTLYDLTCMVRVSAGRCRYE